MTLTRYTRGSGVMLLCDVALGNTLVSHVAKPALDPAVDFQRGWLPRLCGMRSFDSLTAEDKGASGAVRVPEYVVYSSEQVLPRYVLVVRKT